MFLFLDSSERGRLTMALLPSHGRIRSKTITRPRVNVPAALSRFVSLRDLKTLTGICVVAGPGSFSAVRGGVLAANVLARVLTKPLVGVTVEDATNLSVLRKRLAEGALNAVPYVAPVYDAEPNITC